MRAGETEHGWIEGIGASGRNSSALMRAAGRRTFVRRPTRSSGTWTPTLRSDVSQSRRANLALRRSGGGAKPCAALCSHSHALTPVLRHALLLWRSRTGGHRRRRSGGHVAVRLGRRQRDGRRRSRFRSRANRPPTALHRSSDPDPSDAVEPASGPKKFTDMPAHRGLWGRRTSQVAVPSVGVYAEGDGSASIADCSSLQAFMHGPRPSRLWPLGWDVGCRCTD